MYKLDVKIHNVQNDIYIATTIKRPTAYYHNFYVNYFS